MPDPEAVLAHIESNLEAAYERSRSTDPAYTQESCKRRLARPGSSRHRPVTVELKQKLGMDVVFAGFALEDERIHSPNERYELKIFRPRFYTLGQQ